MRHKEWFAGVMVALGALGAAPAAQAAVVYTFVQTETSAPGTVATATFVLSDEAYYGGGSYLIDARPNPTPSRDAPPVVFASDYDGLLGFSTALLGPNGPYPYHSFGLEDFLRTPRENGGGGYLRATLSLFNTPSGPLTGSLDFNNSETEFHFHLLATGVSGSSNSDFFTPCSGCQFSGVLTTTVAVPEPASLALFGAGLLGLGFVRRRRA